MPRSNEPAARGGWVRMTPAEVIAFSDENKREVKRKVDQVIERDMKPQLLKHTRRKPSFGEVEDVYTKWHGHNLILIAKRRGGVVVDRRVDDFEAKSGRLTLTGVDTFDVAYFRHTGRWWTIHSDVNFETALALFRKPSPVWPW